MKKVNEVAVEVADRSRSIFQVRDVAVRAVVALGAAAIVCSAPIVAQAAIPHPPVIDGVDGGVYAQIAGADVQIGVNADVELSPNFGAQSQYEAYIASASPMNPMVVGANGFLAADLGSVEAAIGDVSLASVAPSSAALYDNAYAAPVVVGPVGKVLSSADYSEGYDWYVDPVKLRSAVIPSSSRPVGAGEIPPVGLGVENKAGPGALAISPDDQSVEAQVARGVGPNKVGEYPYFSPRFPDELIEAEIGAYAIVVPAAPQVVRPSISPEMELRALIENGHLPPDVLRAEIDAYAIVVPAAPQVVRPSYSPEAQLRAVVENGHVAPEVLENYVAQERARALYLDGNVAVESDGVASSVKPGPQASAAGVRSPIGIEGAYAVQKSSDGYVFYY